MSKNHVKQTLLNKSENLKHALGESGMEGVARAELIRAETKYTNDPTVENEAEFSNALSSAKKVLKWFVAILAVAVYIFIYTGV